MNITDSYTVKALIKYERNVDSDLRRLLFTVGERTYINCTELRLSHLCRYVIRSHLLRVDPRENLFVKVPRLGYVLCPFF